MGENESDLPFTLLHPERRIKLDQVPDSDHAGVGLVSNSWAHLEGAVERIVWRLARLGDNRGIAVTTHMGIKARLDAARALLRLEFPDSPLVAELDKLAKFIVGREMYGARNEIVHSRIVKLDDMASVRPTNKARGNVRRIQKWTDEEEYTAVSEQALLTASRLREMLTDMHALIREKDGAPPS